MSMQLQDRPMCAGKIRYIRLDKDEENELVIVVQLNGMNTEHYTRFGGLLEYLLDLMFNRVTINLLTAACYDDDHGFGSFQIIPINSEDDDPYKLVLMPAEIYAKEHKG